ncbi:MAG: hypothetical protein HQK54_08865 [Oligoflexales bacterium]|nr:hypothetical protein [Oligoflexales bacterium]
MKTRKSSFLILFFVAVLTNFGCESFEGYRLESGVNGETSQEEAVVRAIAEFVKSSLSDTSADEMRKLMFSQLVHLRLISESGIWTDPQFENHSDYLLGNDLDKDKIGEFVDFVAEANLKNPYLTKFLVKAGKSDFSKYYEKIRGEAHTFFPDLVAYGLVQERLTKLLYQDWRLIKASRDIWAKARATSNIEEHMELFDYAKLASVDYPIRKVIEFNESGSVDQDFLKIMLPVNIMEAVMVDIRTGRVNNAKAGFVLAVHNPESPECVGGSNNCVASYWSKERKAVSVNLPLSKNWADLYQTWNLAFVTRYKYFPYVMVKLLIPQVANYQDKPDEYLYNRMIALYTHLNYALLGRANNFGVYSANIDWSNDDLSQLWGRENLDSAGDYSAKLGEKRSPHRSQKN